MKTKQLTLFLASACILLFSCATGNIDKLESIYDQQPNNSAGNKHGSHTIFKQGAASKSNDEQYSPLAQAILAELNFVRTEPKRYADEVLVPRRQYFKGKLYSEPGMIPLQTQEGITPLNECITALYNTSAIESLTLEIGLCRSAQWLADDQAHTGMVGHEGSDNSAPADRMNRYGTWKITCGENCAYGSHTAREIVVQLLIDDGVPNRGHRINILQNAFTKVGFGFSDKNKAPYGAVSVMDFAGNYVSN